MALTFSFYKDEDEKIWDQFVLEKSMNGLFLQTRKFINYHKEGKFKDCSICVRKGNELVAVILACEVLDEGKKTFFAHKGTTFGGISIAKSLYSAMQIDELMSGLINFLKENNYEKIYLKMVPNIYQKQNVDLLNYFLYKNGFVSYDELNYYIDIKSFKNEDDILANFSANKRRAFKHSQRTELHFQLLKTKKQISEFYEVLLLNLRKLNLHAVHSLADLYDLKFNKFDDRIEFYGVYYQDKMIAGSMLFYFNDDIIHTQYLSSDEEYLNLYPMDYLIYNLIKIGVSQNKKIFSLGICTEDQGRYLNLGLSRFKEGFGTQFCLNRSYEKNI